MGLVHVDTAIFTFCASPLKIEQVSGHPTKNAMTAGGLRFAHTKIGVASGQTPHFWSPVTEPIQAAKRLNGVGCK